MPNGILINRYRPKGMFKHVSIVDRSSNAIFQKLFYASDTVKNLGFFQPGADFFDGRIASCVCSCNNNAHVLLPCVKPVAFQ